MLDFSAKDGFGVVGQVSDMIRGRRALNHQCVIYFEVIVAALVVFAGAFVALETVGVLKMEEKLQKMTKDRKTQNSLGQLTPAKQIKENTAKYFISPDLFPLRLSIKY